MLSRFGKIANGWNRENGHKKMNQSERALKKLKIEINKDIDLAVNMAKSCGLLELLIFIYWLHLMRLLHLFPHAKNEKKELISCYSNSATETIKYVISLITKYGHWGFAIPKKQKAPSINIRLVQHLLKHGNYINSKYETESMIKLFEVQVSGERDQHVRIDMSKIDSDPEICNLFSYFFRIEEDTFIKKDSKKDKDALLLKFKKEYSPLADLFEQEMGVSIDDFCSLIDNLLKRVTDRIQSKMDEIEQLPNGNIDVTSNVTVFQISKCFIFDKTKLFSDFHERFHTILNRLIFDTNDFNERQLRFHHITRQPILSHEHFIILSPELIVDSLFTNIHYSLIESPVIKDECIARQASLFLDRLTSIVTKFDYLELEREKDLYEENKQIGDIDLILRNNAGHYLLIEAKNHALPLDVYFHDIIKTKEHLLYLQNDWEKKVKRRVEHLKIYHDRYSIPDNYLYIVISRFPEIISHYSNLLILSVQEFEVWLEKFQDIKSFKEFYGKYYASSGQKFTIQEMERMQEANVLFGRFAKE